MNCRRPRRSGGSDGTKEDYDRRKNRKTKKVVFEIKDRYDAALAKLDELIQEKKDQQKKDLLKAIDHSDKSIEEILEFVTGKSSQKELE